MRNSRSTVRYDLFTSDKSLHEWKTLQCEVLYGRWYNEHQQHPESCCSLDLPFTEFDTQGLEVDFFLVGWGTDFILENGAWNNDRTTELRPHIRHQRPVHSSSKCVPCAIDTSARPKMILYLPDTEFHSEMRHHLFECGIEDLAEVDSAAKLDSIRFFQKLAVK